MTTTGGTSARPIILCPLEFERQVLEQAGLDEPCDLVCIGPGGENVRHWARTHSQSSRPVIMAGLAGALSPAFDAGSAHVVTLVVEESGEDRWRPTITLSRDETDDANRGDIVATSTQAPVTGRLARQIVSRETGGMLIDLESVAFAATAHKHSWPAWGIVRGVSDDLTTSLPDGVDEWVSDLGRTRWSQVMRSLLLRPQLIPKVMELREHSTAAMKSVATLLHRLVEIVVS